MKSFEINGEHLDAAEISARSLALRHEREAAGESVDLTQRIALQEEATGILIDRTLLIQEARRLGLTPDAADVLRTLAETAKRYDGVAGCRAGADTPQLRDELARRLTVERILEQWRSAVAAPRAEEVRSYYNKNKGRFYRPETIHASHFVRACDTAGPRETVEREVNEFRERVLAGDSLADLALRWSDCPENGGDLGWFARGVMVEEFDAVVFRSALNEVTPVFQTVFGFHFAIVHARRPEGICPFHDVRDEVTRTLWLMKQDREVGKRLATLREQATIRVIR